MMPLKFKIITKLLVLPVLCKLVPAICKSGSNTDINAKQQGRKISLRKFQNHQSNACNEKGIYPFTQNKTSQDKNIKTFENKAKNSMPTANPSSHLPTKSRAPVINWINSWCFSILFLGFALLFFFYRNPNQSPEKMAEGMPKSIYDITVQDINGNDVSLSDYKGKVLLVVNVASKCGLTHANYKEMNVLYEKYKDKGLEILAFPCNQFLSQEPGSNKEIQEVACTMFKAEFPIFDKVEVNGKDTAPLYKFLKSKKGGFFGDRIKWNFTKFLVGKDGKVVERYSPTTSPLKTEKTIQSLLGVS